jgi:hypothetical protein
MNRLSMEVPIFFKLRVLWNGPLRNLATQPVSWPVKICRDRVDYILPAHFSDGSFGMGLTIPLAATAIWVRPDQRRQILEFGKEPSIAIVV